MILGSGHERDVAGNAAARKAPWRDAAPPNSHAFSTVELLGKPGSARLSSLADAVCFMTLPESIELTQRDDPVEFVLLP